MESTSFVFYFDLSIPTPNALCEYLFLKRIVLRPGHHMAQAIWFPWSIDHVHDSRRADVSLISKSFIISTVRVTLNLIQPFSQISTWCGLKRLYQTQWYDLNYKFNWRWVIKQQTSPITPNNKCECAAHIPQLQIAFKIASNYLF